MNAPLGFRSLAARLTRYLNELVRRGEISERGLARLSGYSQPHIHNVLKGARKMNLELADQIMELLGIPLLSLFTQEELSGLAPPRRGEALPIPLLDGPLGGGNPFPQPGRGAARLYFSTSLLNRLISPVVLALDQNERSMWPALWPNDLVLLDRSPIERRRPDFEHVYALSWAGEGWVGRCRVVGGALVVVVDNARQAHSLHGPVPLERKEVLDIVRGKIVWVGRDLDVV